MIFLNKILNLIIPGHFFIRFIIQKEKQENFMIQKYLTEDAVSWLLEESDPSIRYLTLRDILEKKDLDDEYQKVLESEEIVKMIMRGKGELLGSAKNFDLMYMGAMWCFCEAVERGLDKRSDIVIKTAGFIAEKAQMDSGGFTIDWNPPLELACRTGDMISYFLRAGFNDQRVEQGIQWIKDHQRSDGGWLHCPLEGTWDILKLMLFKRSSSCMKREMEADVKSCFYATASCTMALLLFDETKKSLSPGAGKGLEFLLKNRLFMNSRNEPVKSKKQWNRDFRLLGYPVQSQYDILQGLFIAAMGGAFHDPRTAKAFNLLMAKQNTNGTWNMENAQTGMLFGRDSRRHVNKKSKWVTLRVLRLMKCLEGREGMGQLGT